MISWQHLFWKTFKTLFTWWIIYDTHSHSAYDNVKSEDYNSLYDFIIVGGGSAGSALSGRLAENKEWSVLVVESGGEQSVKLKTPWFHALIYDSPHSWYYKTEDQKKDNVMKAYENQRSLWWRGRVIGGTGAINTMIYNRGSRHDYDLWNSMGNDGWSFVDCLPYFKKLENVVGTYIETNTVFHGLNGPMKISEPSHFTPLRSAFLESGRSLGYPIVDPNSWNQYGFAPLLFTIKDGFRWTPSDAYIKGVQNIKVSLNTHVMKVLIKNKRAIGVEIIREGKIRRVYCKKEVIVSAGVMESPRLLMLSGIGPRNHLRHHKIGVIKDLPGVGQNLQDHVASYGLTWFTEPGSSYNPFSYTSSISTYVDWKLGRRGPLSSPLGVEGNAFVYTKYSNSSWPDLQLTFLSVHPGYDSGTLYKEFLGLKGEIFSSYFSSTSFREGFTIYPIVNRPKSRGYIELKSSNPFDDIIIQPNYFKDPSDLLTLIEGMKISRRIGDSAAFKKYGSEFFSKHFPYCKEFLFESDPYWECWVRHMATTDHHPVGTCKMGPITDPKAVVDKDLRVWGIKSLRVVDGSVLPTVPSGNINMPIIMLAEKISDQIIQTYKKVNA